MQIWDSKRKINTFNQDRGKIEHNWARQSYVNIRAMREWSELIDEVTKRCERLCLREGVGRNHISFLDTELPLVLKVHELKKKSFIGKNFQLFVID